LVVSDFDDPKKATVNSFKYHEADKHGHKCPFGSHIRRTFPRDQLHSGRLREQSEEMTRKHRILRRGRIFGKPFVESMKPEDMLQAEKDDGVCRGIHFICLVANIRRQFEFIQNVWANNFTFADLCNEVDPLIAPRPLKLEPLCNEFTVQDPELRRNYREIPQFTRVIGGSYFFLPGIAALKFLAKYKPATTSNYAEPADRIE
jgi:deferrochelatase/peroxidase EfeB